MNRTAKLLSMTGLCLFLILTLTVASAPSALAADTIKIAQIDPFSGPFEYAGRLYNAGWRFAVKEQNEKGGLLGKKIELLTADSELKPDVATRKAKKLILEDKVNFFGTGTGTHVAIALNKVATGYKTLMLNWGGMGDVAHGKEFSPYAFRICQNAYSFTAALAQLMATKPYRKYYIICQDYAWGHDVAKAFEDEMKKYVPDAKIVGVDFHPLATKDFGPYITKVRAAGADAVFTGNWGPDARLLVKQARDLGLKSPFPFVMTFGVDPYVENELGDASVGIHYAYDYTLCVDTPANKDFIKRYREKIGKDEKDYLSWWPVGSTGHTAIGAKMVFAAIEKAGSVDPAKFIPVFEGFKYQTPVGEWIMRACDHQVMLPMFGGVVEAGDNPYFNGSIDPKVKFPWMNKVTTFTPDTTTIPATPDYNPRCK
ncbi:MAG: ABC transporter substrate-binding protein [Proteobacteria bacterium]|nr:ABC transporter substrate-binding protein [Pseudomonadota bacterium]